MGVQLKIMENENFFHRKVMDFALKIHGKSWICIEKSSNIMDCPGGHRLGPLLTTLTWSLGRRGSEERPGRGLP